MKTLLATTATVALLAATPAQADTAIWGEAGGWHIRVDRTLGDGCFAAATHEDGGAVRFGFDMVTRSGYFAVTDARWHDAIEVGSTYNLTIQFDGLEPWEGEASGMTIGDLRLFRVTMDNDGRFFEELARSYTVSVAVGGTVISRLKLTGSAAAATAVLECQETMNDAAPLAESNVPEKRA